MKKTANLPFLFLRAYPKWWRDRYGDEMEVMVQCLLDSGRSPSFLALDLLKSSIGAWTRGTGAPATHEFWSARAQRSLLVAALPWFVIFPLNWVFAASNSEHGSFHGTTSVRLSSAGVNALDSQRIVFDALLVSGFAALVGWQILRGGLEEQNVWPGWFRVTNRIPMVGIALIIAALLLGERNGTSSIAEICAFLGVGLLVVSWLSMPRAIVLMMRDGRLPIERLHAEVWVSIVMAGLNVVSTVFVAAYLMAIPRQPIPLPGASYMLYRSTLGDWNAALLAGFVLLSMMSATGAITARQAYARVRLL